MVEYFKNIGAEILLSEQQAKQTALSLQAFLLDWDGVFNGGVKGHLKSSPYAEPDSMGLNMLRFGYWLKNGKIPYIAIITGENNRSAFELAHREHFNAVYFAFNHKIEALEHLNQAQKLDKKQIAFMFDDILDISVAQEVGMRFLAKRKSSPLFLNYAKKYRICDYITSLQGEEGAVREVCEFLLGMIDLYDTTVSERVAYSEAYQAYLSQRRQIETRFYKKTDKEVTLLNINELVG